MAQIQFTIDEEILKELFTDAGRDKAYTQLLEALLNQVLLAESEEQIGVGRYVRHDDRTSYRNGVRQRQLKTRIGSITLDVPKHRNGTFSTKLFKRYERSKQALVLAMMEMVINGVSTRKIAKITETLCGEIFSKSTVSKLCERLDPEVKAFQNRPLEQWYPFLQVDAVYIKVRENGRVVSKGFLVAIGVGEDGQREILGFTVAAIVGIVGVVSAIGLGSIAYAASTSLKSSADIPTQYTVPDIVSVAVAPEKLAAQRNYTIADSPLDYDQPKADALSRDHAADIGAAELTKVFGLDLNGREIEMGYTAAREGNRAFWSGSILISGDWRTGKSYYFGMNAVTGDIHTTSYGRSINASASLDFDSAVAKNPTIYENLAKKIAEEQEIVGGTVRSAVYANQGYSHNDPNVTVLVIGENGQHAQLTFSRYDQTFTGAMYNGAMLDFYALVEQIEAGTLPVEEAQVFG